MAKYGYGAVTDRAFVAFQTELEHGAWGEISIKKVDSDDQRPSALLAEASVETAWKLRLRWSASAVAAVLGATGGLSELDIEWDRLQRRLDAQVSMHETDEDPEVRAAAARCRAALLTGTGTAQTSLSYAAEVDFGRSQVTLAAGAPLSHDVKKLGLTSTLHAIADVTERFALAQGIGTPGVKPAARSTQLKNAVIDCVSSFNAVHESLDWTLDHTPPGAERTRLEALRAPLQALLDRHPITPLTQRVTPPAPDTPSKPS